MEINTASALEDEGVKEENTCLEVGLKEVIKLLSSVSLTSVIISDYFVVMRSNFDLTISGEPYTGLVLLLNLMTGKYFSRIWNQTVATGTIVDSKELMEACDNHFGQGRPCMGCPLEENYEHDKEDFLISQTPMPRKIARTCLKVLGKDTHPSISSCSECVRLSYGKMNKDAEDHLLLTGPKTEYMDTHVAENSEEFVTISAIHNVNDIQEGDRICNAEIGSKTGQQQKKHPFNYHNKVEGGSSVRNNKKYRCKLCPYTAARRNQLRDHIAGNHNNIQDNVCQVKIHMNVVHNMGEKKFKCEKCPFATVYSYSLKQHIEIVHEQLKNHVCEECGYAFSQKGNLLKHIERVHSTSKKNYVCDECGHATDNKTNLESHKKIHSKEEKKFRCDQCPYASHFSRMLRKHTAIVHDKIRNHACAQCAYAASSADNLRKHIKAVHQNIRDHVCGDCGYAASEKSNLMKHIEGMHKKRSSHICQDCGYTTFNKGNLEAHRLKRHLKTDVGAEPLIY